MNDQLQVDNSLVANLALPIEKNKIPFRLDSKQPGPETGSTALDLKRINEQQAATDDPLMQSLIRDITNEKPPPINNLPAKKIKETKLNKQQQGFLMPFVNGINSLMDGIWSALKSLIPMKK